MKTKATVSLKKQAVIVKDLKARKNPKGGVVLQATSAGTISAGSSMTVPYGGRRGSP